MRPHGSRRGIEHGNVPANVCAVSQELVRQVKREIVALVPQLRAFARALAGNVERADHLVEETILRAMGRITRLPAEADPRTWLFTILHQTFYRQAQMHEQGNVIAGHAARLGDRRRGGKSIACENIGRVLAHLCAEDREVLTLICGAGCSYESAAKICGRSVLAMRRQMNGAHARLAKLCVSRGLTATSPAATEKGWRTSPSGDHQCASLRKA